VSQHRAAGDRDTPGNAARKPGAGRHSAKHRVARRSTPSSTQIVGLTAALAAAAGAVGFSHSTLASPTQANSAVNLAALSLDNGSMSGITTARIQARQLATRDSSRVQLADTTKKQSAAAQLAKARAAKLNATQALTAKRATALALAKAKQEAAEQKVRESATRCEMMVTGYHITATFGQGGNRWAHNHTGLDFAAPIGTRIGAVMKGVVIFPTGPAPTAARSRSGTRTAPSPGTTTCRSSACRSARPCTPETRSARSG